MEFQFPTFSQPWLFRNPSRFLCRKKIHMVGGWSPTHWTKKALTSNWLPFNPGFYGGWKFKTRNVSKKTTTRVVIYQSFISTPVFSGTFNSKTSPLGALRSIDINTPRKGRSCATLAAPTKASTYENTDDISLLLRRCVGCAKWWDCFSWNGEGCALYRLSIGDGAFKKSCHVIQILCEINIIWKIKQPKSYTCRTSNKYRIDITTLKYI